MEYTKLEALVAINTALLVWLVIITLLGLCGYL